MKQTLVSHLGKNQQTIKMELDTGSLLAIINEKTYKTLQQKPVKHGIWNGMNELLLILTTKIYYLVILNHVHVMFSS